MNDSTDPFLSADALIELARRYAASSTSCDACSALVCPGWESMPGGFSIAGLRRIGTLKQPEVDDPTLAEHHPAGSNLWSADAPIAPAFYPYNRCDVWQCSTCSRPFLRYTEYGGYYQDDRIRELKAEHIDSSEAI